MYSSSRGLNPPILLYVGRIRDSRKGLRVLLEAVELLCGVEEIPGFVLWIAGGSPAEAVWVRNAVEDKPALRLLLNSGRVIIWGRVDNQALPELFSRALVTIVPSLREEFGIVAIEAQACGSPVVASRVGGLQDIVLHSITGTLVPPDDPYTLALALSAYLRNPSLASRQGRVGRRWVTLEFSKDSTFRQYQKLYRGQNCGVWNGPARLFERSAAKIARGKLASVFGDHFEWVGLSPGSSSHTSFLIRIDGKRFFAKALGSRPSIASLLFPLPSAFEGLRKAGAIYRSYLSHRDNPAVPRIIAKSERVCVIATEWLDEAPDSSDLRALSKSLWERLSLSPHLGRDWFDEEAEARYLCILKKLWRRRSKALPAQIDEVGASLNACLAPYRQFFRVHPQVEIWRTRKLLKGSLIGGALPDLARAAERAWETFCEDSSLILTSARLCHGDVKPSHLRVSGNDLLVVDPEEAHFAFGPLDLGMWAYYACFREARNPVGGIGAVSLLRDLLKDEREFLMAVAWMVSEAFFGGIRHAVFGRPKDAEAAAAFVLEILESL